MCGGSEEEGVRRRGGGGGGRKKAEGDCCGINYEGDLVFDDRYVVT